MYQVKQCLVDEFKERPFEFSLAALTFVTGLMIFLVFQLTVVLPAVNKIFGW